MLGPQWHYIGILQYIPFIYTVNFNVRPTVALYRNLMVHEHLYIQLTSMLGPQWHYIGILQYIPFIYTVNFNVRPTVALYRNLTVHTIQC